MSNNEKVQSTKSEVQGAEEFQPFGPEWEKEMLKFQKRQIISMYATARKRINYLELELMAASQV